MPDISLTLDLTHDPELGPVEDMAAIVQQLYRFASLPTNAIRFVIIAEDRDAADDIEARLSDLLEERPYSIDAKLKRVDKSALRRVERRSVTPSLTPIERAVKRADDALMA